MEGHSGAVCSYSDKPDLGRYWGICACIHVRVTLWTKFCSECFFAKFALPTLVNDSVPCTDSVVSLLFQGLLSHQMSSKCSSSDCSIVRYT